MRLHAAWTDWLDAERRRLPLWLPVFMGAGVLFYYSLRFEPAVWLGPAAALLAAAAAVARPGWRWLLVPVAAAALGFASARVATALAPPIEADLPYHAVVVTGVVHAVELLPEGRRIVIRPAFLDDQAQPLRRSVRVRLRSSDDGALQTGDNVSVRALVRGPAPPSYPGAWDLQRDAFYTGLGASGYAIEAVQRTAQAQPHGFMRLVQRLRETIAGRVSAVIPGAAGAVSVTLLTGASMAIPAADHAAFRDSGLAHLLAVAGLHIGIVMGFALLLARSGLALSERASLFWPTKKLAALAALAAGGGYMVLTGMHVPIMRSFAMACLFTLAILADRLAVSLRGLAVAATVLMLLAPWEVPDVSFQMSFSAVLALIAGYEALRPWLRRLHGTSPGRRFASHLVALALTSALAGTASAPYGAYHFGHVQVYFVLANMVAVPLTALWVMPAGLIGLMLMPLHLEALALVPMGWGAEAILWVARVTSALPAATVAVPHMPAWGLCAFSLGLAWLGLWRTRLRLIGVAIMAAGLASPAWDHPPDLLVSGDGRLIALRTPQGAFLQAAKGSPAFTRDAWAQYWAAGSFRPMADDPAGFVRCQADACLLRPYADRPGALLARGAAHPAGCAQVSVIVSGEPARGLCPRPWPALDDRFTVWRSGSAAIWLEPDGARVLTDRAERGERPWVPPPPKPRAPAVSPLPPALVDEAVQPGPAAGVAAAEQVNGE
jgi:competence protein ComEC